MVKLFRAMRTAALFAVILTLAACGGPAAPSTSSSTAAATSTTSTAVMAPPPPGVDGSSWRIAFAGDAKLYRPDSVQLVLPNGLEQGAVNVFNRVIELNNLEVGDKTPYSLGSKATGANLLVSTKQDLVCKGVPAAACTTLTYDLSTGKITGGTMVFESIDTMYDVSVVMHETLCRGLGIVQDYDKPGICNANPKGALAPSKEEKLLIQGRYLYPLLAVYSAQ